MDNNIFLILCGMCAFGLVCLVLFHKTFKTLKAVNNNVEGIALQKEGKRKRNIRKALKTLLKAGKALAKQEPVIFKDVMQLTNFNLIIKDNGIYKILTCDEVIGKELLEAVEDLSIDFVVDKI